MNHFRNHWRRLYANGWPFAEVIAGRGHLTRRGWPEIAHTRLPEPECARIAASPHPRDIAIVAGARIDPASDERHLILLDVDRDEVRRAVLAILPSELLIRVCNKGFLAPLAITGKSQSATIISPGGEALAEVLGYGHSAMAFGTHRRTGRAYRWVSDRTPLNTPLPELPTVPADFIERLRHALAPWAAAPKPTSSPQRPTTSRGEVRHPDKLIQHILRTEVAELASMTHGRNATAFRIAVRLAEIGMPHSEILEHLYAAAEQAYSGHAYKRDKLQAIHTTVRSAWRRARRVVS